MLEISMRGLKLILIVLLFSVTAAAEPLTLPLDARPQWLQRDGIVMAGSWEPLLFRVRRDGSDGYEPTAEQRAAYEYEQSPEMVQKLKEMGVNFIMSHCYKGGGLETERQSMADIVRFTQLCHAAGLRVGVYNYSGAFIWELFFKEHPEAKDWVLHNENGEPEPYGSATYRYYWNRNHPEAQAFYRELVRFAIEEVGTDLIHFDNYIHGAGTDANSVQRFRAYLRQMFAADQLAAMGIENVSTVLPEIAKSQPKNLFQRAWLDFCAQSLADPYWDMARFARSLRKDILVECNPHGPGARMYGRIDHGRLLQGGEAFWDEGQLIGLKEGVLHSRIRTYKVARRMDNMAFAYTITPLQAAESMAFNRDCLGCVCWFEYGKIVERPGYKEPMAEELLPYIRFFHQRRDLLRNTRVVADVAVLRSYPSQVFAESKYGALTSEVEQRLIEERAAFQIIYEHHLADLDRYRALVLAGCIALSDEQVAHIQGYVRKGGNVCVIGPLATHDQWMRPRPEAGLAELPEENVFLFDETASTFQMVNQALENKPSLIVEAQRGLCVELMQQSDRCLVHLVNYRQDGPVNDIAVQLRIPPGKHVSSVMLASPEQKEDMKLSCKVDDGYVRFTVPDVSVYEIAAVSF